MYDNKCNSSILLKNLYSLVFSWEKKSFLGWGCYFPKPEFCLANSNLRESEKHGHTLDPSHGEIQNFESKLY